MRILTTKITGNLEELLLNEVKQALSADKKVYYIVPSSLSFEKEKTLIKELSKDCYTALFDFVVTRFKRLPYYFDKEYKSKGKIELSQNGQIMLFESVLMTLDETEIPYFSSFKKSP
ncbi:MAG: ATP-dependent nuclease subunit B, partial [Streptococcaceae bacterium]|nr:ATP-dependent nuclease subunit B [Streptococcaceae bacterium]